MHLIADKRAGTPQHEPGKISQPLHWCVECQKYDWACKHAKERTVSEAAEKRTSSEKPRYPVGVSVLITNECGEVLLGRRRSHLSAGGLFSTPGGRIEDNETLFETAARETAEETGLVVLPQDVTVIGFKEHKRFGEHYFMVYVHVSRFKGDHANLESDKHEDWQWFNLDEIPVSCTEPPDMIELLKARDFLPAFIEISPGMQRQMVEIQKYINDIDDDHRCEPREFEKCAVCELNSNACYFLERNAVRYIYDLLTLVNKARQLCPHGTSLTEACELCGAAKVKQQ